MVTEDTISKLRFDLIIHRPPEYPGNFLLEDPESGRAFTFKEREFTIITLLDGESSLKAIARIASQETGITLSVATVVRFVDRLSQLGLLEQNGEQRSIASRSHSDQRHYIEIK